jgi:hypothetical protein
LESQLEESVLVLENLFELNLKCFLFQKSLWRYQITKKRCFQLLMRMKSTKKLVNSRGLKRLVNCPKLK